MKQYLLVPGPTPLPQEVLTAASRQMLNHRGPEFGRLLAETLEALRRIFMTRNAIIPFTASGTGGLEAAVVNVCSPGDTVVAICAGAFADRFAAIAEAFGARVVRVSFPWGAGRRSPGGARGAARDAEALMVVDAVRSLGAIELRADEWGIDVENALAASA